jgi:hypothetical protein
MNIDDVSLGDEEFLRLSRQTPSTEIGKQVLPKWRERFTDPQPSEFYRGYAIVLWMLWKQTAGPVTIRDIERIIDAVHDSRMASRVFVRGTDLDAGATIAAANAWEAAQSGVAASQVAANYESELIYVAKLFLDARSREQGATVDIPKSTVAPKQSSQESKQASQQPEQASQEQIRKKRRWIAAGVLGVIGLLIYGEHPNVAVVCFFAAAFFFFAEQPANQVLDKLLSPPDKRSS